MCHDQSQVKTPQKINLWACFILEYSGYFRSSGISHSQLLRNIPARNAQFANILAFINVTAALIQVHVNQRETSFFHWLKITQHSRVQLPAAILLHVSAYTWRICLYHHCTPDNWSLDEKMPTVQINVSKLFFQPVMPAGIFIFGTTSCQNLPTKISYNQGIGGSSGRKDLSKGPTSEGREE